jgi:predicted nucleotidyltransferase
VPFLGMEMLNKDYKEMLQCLSEENVKFLLIGAYALTAYGYPRATKDIDFFVLPALENASSLSKNTYRA